MRIPAHLLVIDAVGTLLLVLGIWGALAGGGEILPFLSTPRVAWSLAAIGLVLVLAVSTAIVRLTLDARRKKAPGGGSSY